MAAFALEKKSTRQLIALLETLSAKSIPYATRETLNQLAFTSMREGKKEANKKMILRNKWTAGSIRAKPTRSPQIRSQIAFMGSTEGYMRIQEEGGRKAAKGRHGLHIPTSWAAGQEGVKPRTKLVTRSKKMSNIKLLKFRNAGKTRKQRMVRTVQEAVRTKKRNVFMELGTNTGVTTKGIFRVVGGRVSKRGWPKGARLKLIHDISRKSVRIPKHEWMVPAAKRTALRSPQMYRKALLYQLNRQKHSFI
jgi:hypothetical protein